MINILVVEDDSDINNLLKDILKDEGYNVTQAYSGSEAEFCIKEKEFNMILLDLMLPGVSGEELISEIRKSSESYVIVISAKDSIESKINALSIGADDYITKPFDVREVSVRIKVGLRRNSSLKSIQNGCEDIVQYKDIKVNCKSRQVFVGDKELHLTVKEFDILSLLIKNPNKVFTKSNILESVWGEDFFGDENTVNVHVSNIRSKISKISSNEDYIKTVWGIGFKLED